MIVRKLSNRTIIRSIGDIIHSTKSNIGNVSQFSRSVKRSMSFIRVSNKDYYFTTSKITFGKNKVSHDYSAIRKSFNTHSKLTFKKGKI